MKNFYSILLAIILCACSTPEIPQPVGGTADFYYNEISSLYVQFYNTSSAGLKAYYWDFGDGTSAGSEDPVHRYTKAGTYKVKLTCKDKYNYTYNVTKNVTVGGGSGGGGNTGEETSWTQAYITGFRFYKIPYNDYYYKVEFICASLAGNKTIKTDKKELYKSQLPTDFILETPYLMPGADMAFVYCSLMDMYVYQAHYRWQELTQCLHQTKELTFDDIDGKSECVFTSDNGETQVAVLFEYK